MKILHIANGYSQSKLYKELISKLIKFIDLQYVFVPLRDSKSFDKFKIKNKKVIFFYSLIITSFFYRIFFPLKIRKSVKAINKNTNVSNYNVLHAHSLFSDGAVAMKFFKRYKIPFIIAVRNTDINIFLKYLLYLKPLGKKILKQSSKIVFLSDSYKNRLKNIYPKIAHVIDNKSIVIPNGVNDFWIENISIASKNITNNQIHILYVGEIRKNKNIINSIKAIDLLKDKYNIFFTIVGEGLFDEKEYLDEIKLFIKNKNNIKIYKAVEKEELLKFYRNSHIFLMPSYTESFGLVYVEALSQGLPVIYTKNEGFDNIFDEGKVGFHVEPSNIEDISNKIELVINNYSKIQKNTYKEVEKFDWNKISEIYFNIYKTIME